MNKIFYIRVITGLLFLALFALGLNLAKNKPLWNDELYTQVATIETVSYLDLLLKGPAEAEANTSPLFYLIQKVFCDTIRYQTPQPWMEGNWAHEDLSAQLTLRVVPVYFMALAIVAIFYFFAKNYSFLSGLYSLGISLSSYMLWMYWAEARHYALWFFLTALQCLLFISLMRAEKIPQRIWQALTAVHIALALTVVLSFGQIAIVTLLLWIFKERDWREFAWLSLVPMTLCLFFYWRAGSGDFRYWLDGGVAAFILPCFSLDRLLLVLIYGAYAGWIFWKQKRFVDEGGSFFFLTVLMFLAALGAFSLFKLADTHGQGGNPISTRYFIFITPVGIIATTLFSIHLFRAAGGDLWLKLNVGIGLAGLLVFGFLRNCYWVVGLF